MSKRKEELRSQIDHLIHDDLPLEVPGYEEENIDDVAKRTTDYVDYTETKARTLTKAKKLMDGLLKLYLSEEIIEDHEYIKAKLELDKMASQYPPERMAPKVTWRLNKQILEFDGETDRNKISAYIEALPISDSKYIRQFLKDNEPSLDLNQTVVAPSGELVSFEITFGVEFFRPFF
jgi:hypothetical protein